MELEDIDTIFCEFAKFIRDCFKVKFIVERCRCVISSFVIRSSFRDKMKIANTHRNFCQR